MAWVATAVIGAGLIGAGATIYGSNKAATAQTQAATTAANTATGMYDTTRADLQPFVGYGTNAGNAITANLGTYTNPVPLPTGAPTAADIPTAPQPMTQAQLEQTPGYQFNLTQGMRGVTNSAAARGLGSSGAALKGAATFATGLADSTYQNQFANQQALFGNAEAQYGNKQTNFGNQQTLFGDTQANQSNAFQRLSSLLSTGEDAAAKTGNAGTAAANTAAGAQIGAGNAQAAAANATGSSISNAAGGIGGYAMYNGLYGGSVGNMPATGSGSPSLATSNAYALSQGINPYG